MSWKKLLLIRRVIIALFVNTFTADDEYSCQNRENLRQQIQIQLSQKSKTFFEFFIAFLNFTSNPEYFEKKMRLIG